MKKTPHLPQIEKKARKQIHEPQSHKHVMSGLQPNFVFLAEWHQNDFEGNKEGQKELRKWQTRAFQSTAISFLIDIKTTLAVVRFKKQINDTWR